MLQRVDAEEQPVRRAEEAPGGKDFGVYGETLVGGRKDLQGRVVQPRAQEGLQPFRSHQPALRYEIACAAGAPQVVRNRDGYIERVFLQGEFLVELHNAVFYKAFRDRRVGIGDLFAAFRCQGPKAVAAVASDSRRRLVQWLPAFRLPLDAARIGTAGGILSLAQSEWRAKR